MTEYRYRCRDCLESWRLDELHEIEELGTEVADLICPKCDFRKFIKMPEKYC